MPLELMYITNNPTVALIAEKYGVNRIMIDLETLGKEERQKGMNTVKSRHTVCDVSAMSKVLTTAELLVRVNPWNDQSVDEVEAVIAAGAELIMLPMWTSAGQADAFLKTVDHRARTMLLLETKEAAACLDEVLENPLVDEIFIGLNDLHLSYGMTFMFEPLADGTVEMLCQKCKEKGVSYGFGGIARIGEGMLPAERIVMEHYRLGSSRAILSRSFCNAEEIEDVVAIESIFRENMARLRAFEESLAVRTEADYVDNSGVVKCCVKEIVERIKEKRNCG